VNNNFFFKCKKKYEEYYKEYIKCLESCGNVIESGGQVRPKIALSLAARTNPISLGPTLLDPAGQ
jgi:hypothetical protein